MSGGHQGSRGSGTPKPEAPKQEPAKPGTAAEKPAYRYDNFFEEFRDVEVRVVLHNERVLSGRVVESRRYWIKLTTDGSTYYYINKAWIVYVQPLKVRK